MKNILMLLTIGVMSFISHAQSNWEIDLSKSKVNFVINGPLGSDVNGKLNSPKGNIIFEPTLLENSSFSVNVESNTLDTDNKKRDEHLKKEEFFDVLKYKTISFASNKVEKSGEDGYVVTGNLKMKDKIKLVKIYFTYMKTGNIAKWNGKLSLNRIDFGVGKSSFMIGNEVKINIELVATSK